MSGNEREDLRDRNLVPADEIDHLNILRYDPRDPPTVAIFDPPTRCYVANEEWAKHIMGAVLGLQAWKAWTGDEDELNDAVQSIMEFMVGEVCAMFLLRQSPTNLCVLEQSIDGGDNWTEAFDYGLCMGGGSDTSLTIYINIAIENINTLNALYIDAGLDITVMYPNVEYDAGSGDDDRNTALCYAMEALTEGVFNAVAIAVDQELSRNGFMSQLVSYLTGGFFASDGTLLAALSQSITNELFGIDALALARDALDNSEARRSVVCCLYDNMEGATPTFALWETAGDGCGFASGSDMELLLAVLAPLFDSLDAYLSWVTLVSNGYDLAVSDLIGNDCLTCGGWSANRLDGDGHADMTIVVEVPTTPCLGTWSGTIFLGCETGPGESANGALEIDITGAVITNVTMDISAHKTRADGTTDWTTIAIDGVNFDSHSRTALGAFTHKLDTGEIAETGSLLELGGYVRTNTVGDPGFWSATQIHVEGRGTNPFS